MTFKSYKTNRPKSWMEKQTCTHKQTVPNTLKRHTNNNSRLEWGETSVCKCVSHNCFSTSQQKLDIFHFLLWRVWGWRDRQGAGLSPWKLCLFLSGHISDWNRCCEQHTDAWTAHLQRRELLELSWTQCIELLNATRLSRCSPYFLTLFRCSSFVGSVYEVNHVIGGLEVLSKSPSTWNNKSIAIADPIGFCSS